MSSATDAPEQDQLVPDELIPHKNLPPLIYRAMPEALPWRKMIGPSILLAGLSLGSGEFILWPYITFKSGFVFFWACLLGVITQYFVNMEIERYTLVTGESAITGFCRLSKQWAWIMLLMNIIPWAWPGWATGAGSMISWTVFGPEPTATVELEAKSIASLESMTLPAQVLLNTSENKISWKGEMTAAQADVLKTEIQSSPQATQITAAIDSLLNHHQEGINLSYSARYNEILGILGLFVVGIVLTAGPVVYNTVEKIQFVLVGIVFVCAILLGFYLIKPYAVEAMFTGLLNIGEMPDAATGLGTMTLLGALAFAGAGGTMNLSQSNFIMDKGYGMGKYIGRITSPLTGQEEPISQTGYHFPHDAENMARWRGWWRGANMEHFLSFFLTCFGCILLLTLIAYSMFYTADGELVAGADRYGSGMNFIWGQASIIEAQFGRFPQYIFMLMGAIILLTTELGVLDATARISADIVKVNYLRNNDRFTPSRLYFLFLWGEILLGSAILLYSRIDPTFKQPLVLLTISAASNGGVMFLYSIVLLYLNSKILPRSISITPLRFIIMIWACAFFGYFTLQAIQIEIWPFLTRG
ncbi:MAG: Nramp family divalent metal transporter [Planctomycetaceae bacterium]|nr:Nramp family divalent metal transporter [Planctomycetaceae bacterium]